MKSKTRRNEEIITINIERQWSLFATSFALSLIYSIVIISISDSDLPVILKNTLILFYLGVYLLPSIISYDLISYYQDDMDIPQVKHPNAFMITSINLLLGWTIIIWLILLYLSVKPGIVKVKKITFEPIDNFETREKITAVSVIKESSDEITPQVKPSLELTKEMAEQGDSSSQYDLGYMYMHGQGVPQDYVMAHMYFNIAAVSGYKNAIENRGVVGQRMTTSQVAESQKLSREWMRTHQ